jgi:hypothetical protein
MLWRVVGWLSQAEMALGVTGLIWPQHGGVVGGDADGNQLANSIAADPCVQRGTADKTDPWLSRRHDDSEQAPPHPG